MQSDKTEVENVAVTKRLLEVQQAFDTSIDLQPGISETCHSNKPINSKPKFERHKKIVNMEAKMLKINMLSIILAGALLTIVGIILYFTRSYISYYTRYFLPLPPISVAAYVFVFNMFKYFNTQIPTFTVALIDVLLSTLVVGVAFLSFVTLMILFVWLIA